MGSTTLNKLAGNKSTFCMTKLLRMTSIRPAVSQKQVFFLKPCDCMNWISLATKSRVQSSKGLNHLWIGWEAGSGFPHVSSRVCAISTGMEVSRCRVGKPPAVGLGLVYRFGSVANHHLIILSRWRREGDGFVLHLIMSLFKMSKSCTADVFLYEPTIGVVGHVLVDVKLMIRFSLCKYGLQKFGGKRTTSSGGRSLTQRHSGAF